MNRTIFVIIFIVVGIISVSCHRNEYCESGINGYWLHLDQPKENVIGYFIPDNDLIPIDSACSLLLYKQGFYVYFPFYPVKGKVSKEFKNQPNKPMRVHCTLDYFVTYHNYFGFEASKILCIKEIE